MTIAVRPDHVIDSILTILLFFKRCRFHLVSRKHSSRPTDCLNCKLFAKYRLLFETAKNRIHSLMQQKDEVSPSYGGVNKRRCFRWDDVLRGPLENMICLSATLRMK